MPVATSVGAAVAPGASRRAGRAGAGSVRICVEELLAVSNYSLGRNLSQHRDVALSWAAGEEPALRLCEQQGHSVPALRNNHRRVQWM